MLPMRSMANRIFIDTNIFLDLLLKRGELGLFANNFFAKSIDAKAQLFTSVACIQTVIYVLQKSGCSREVVNESVSKINELVTLASTSADDIDQAVQSNFRDLEDAILYYTAISNNCEKFVTRNVGDFPVATGEIEVLKPEDF